MRADLPTPPLPTMITLCRELELEPFLAEDMVGFNQEKPVALKV